MCGNECVSVINKLHGDSEDCCTSAEMKQAKFGGFDLSSDSRLHFGANADPETLATNTDKYRINIVNIVFISSFGYCQFACVGQVYVSISKRSGIELRSMFLCFLNEQHFYFEQVRIV